VDYLDIHFYPQASGVFSNQEDPKTVALRMHATKSLYNSGYVDESWINLQINLIPRMKDIISRNCPSVGFAITEYSFGDDTLPSAASATAEALAIFGREGVDIANKWTAATPQSRAESAFKLFLNYDGKNSKLFGNSIGATTSNMDLATTYAIRSASHIFILFFNKDPNGGRVTVNGSLDGTLSTLSATAKRYSFGIASVQVVGRDDVAIQNGKYSLTLAILEATVLVVPISA